jgi:hypothetical protein
LRAAGDKEEQGVRWAAADAVLLVLLSEHVDANLRKSIRGLLQSGEADAHMKINIM